MLQYLYKHLFKIFFFGYVWFYLFCFWCGKQRRCALYVRACDVRRNVSATLQLIDAISWCNGTRLVTSHGCLRQALRCGAVAKVQKAAATEPAGSGQRFWHGRGRRGADRRSTASRRQHWRPWQRRRHCRAEWRLWLWRRSCQQKRLSGADSQGIPTPAIISGSTAGAFSGDILVDSWDDAPECCPGL